jgi:electron transfer flavoprotein beta subunit
MKIAVCLKQTFDTEAVIRIDGQGQIDKSGVKMIVNPYDEYAVEEALKIGGEVVVFGVGGDECKEALRHGLAMGANRAVLVNDAALADADHSGVALALAKAIEQEKCDMILCGWVAIDDGAAQVPARLAEIMNIPQITVVTQLTVNGDKIECQREGDGIAHIVEAPLPAVISAQKGLNEPRYPTMKGIMQAKKKPIDTIDLAKLGLSADQVKAKTESTGFELPAPRQAGKILEGEVDQAVSQLVSLLHEEAKVV